MPKPTAREMVGKTCGSNGRYTRFTGGSNKLGGSYLLAPESVEGDDTAGHSSQVVRASTAQLFDHSINSDSNLHFRFRRNDVPIVRVAGALARIFEKEPRQKLLPIDTEPVLLRR
jgi:hypothetical protein